MINVTIQSLSSLRLCTSRLSPDFGRASKSQSVLRTLAASTVLLYKACQSRHGGQKETHLIFLPEVNLLFNMSGLSPETLVDGVVGLVGIIPVVLGAIGPLCGLGLRIRVGVSAFEVEISPLIESTGVVSMCCVSLPGT